jgi:hypothetical protein
VSDVSVIGSSSPVSALAEAETPPFPVEDGIDVSEVPKKREANMGQWLASRNLGLVPVASPETFEWPGRFLGLRSDSSTWAVFFGVPPGIVYDPLAEPAEGKQNATLDAAFVRAEHDPRDAVSVSLFHEQPVDAVHQANNRFFPTLFRLQCQLSTALSGPPHLPSILQVSRWPSAAKAGQYRRNPASFESPKGISFAICCF